MNATQKFAVACPVRSVCDHHAKVFAKIGRLQGHYLGTRRGAQGIPEALSRRFPIVGLISYAGAKAMPLKGESVKVACFPLFDWWVKRQLPEGTAVFSSYGYTVECFKKARQTGGMTLLDGGNSHPANFWRVVTEEHQRWNVDVAPYPKTWNERGLRSVELTDWVFSPSSYVTNSFIERGFPAERVLSLPYPIDLTHFSPDPPANIPKSPLKVVCTGGVSLRKGFPYLLEAMRLIRKERDAVLMLTEGVHESMLRLIHQYPDVPIDWAPRLSHDKLGQRLKEAHVFALLSLEDGFALTAAEAMACGVPVVLTPNTGFSDFVVPGKNGEIVPIRDPQSAADAIIRCYELKTSGQAFVDTDLKSSLSFETFERKLMTHLEIIDKLGPRAI
ncbi:MAG: glycosyltransferase family 4 protein [Armatimonadetes bacterium]|nr:glycosyltransferase family 4 protein [Akkermansiaceae bacterium]